MTLKEWLQESPFSISLSAGFFGFYSHCGFMKALWENDLRPTSLSGSSAGALISGLVSAGLSPHQIEELLLSIKKSDFWDFKIGAGLLAGNKFENLLKTHLPENFDQLEIPLKVSTFHLGKGKTVVHEKGDLVSAVRASCCFPLLFHPVKIQGERYLDGGILDWTATHALPKEERILIHLLNPGGLLGYALKKKIQTQVKKSEFRKALTVDRHISMGPNKMNLAQIAIQTSYEQTLKKLDEKLKS